MSKHRKPHKPTIKRLRKQLWFLVSHYIRRRDKNICFTCGIRTEPGMAGHFIPSAVGGALLRYHELNIHCQCFRCNINLSGNWPVYLEKMKRIYGEKVVNELLSMRYKTIKADILWYLEKISHYENELLSYQG